MTTIHTPTRLRPATVLISALLLALPLRAQQPAPVDVPWDDTIPPGTSAHVERALAESTRHGEFVDITLADGALLNTWIVYPERADKAPVVLVIHNNRGLTPWARAVADQLAQDGFIGIAPDFLSGKGPDGGGTASFTTPVPQAIRALTSDEVVARLNAAMEHGRALPASSGKTGVLGFCWGGSQSFGYAMAQPALDACVVFYGDVPGASATAVPEDRMEAINAPVLGLYAGNDARINATLPPTIAAMMKLKKTYEFHTFEGSGHGFTYAQDAQGGANNRAVQQSWPLTLSFLRRHLE